jgi:hypothetical protein
VWDNLSAFGTGVSEQRKRETEKSRPKTRRPKRQGSERAMFQLQRRLRLANPRNSRAFSKRPETANIVHRLTEMAASRESVEKMHGISQWRVGEGFDELDTQRQGFAAKFPWILTGHSQKPCQGNKNWHQRSLLSADGASVELKPALVQAWSAVQNEPPSGRQLFGQRAIRSADQ